MTSDQKRALGIGGVGIGAFLLYTQLHKKSAPAQLVNTQASVTPYTPQAPVVLAPGQSVYDPNSEGLINTPGATSGSAATTLLGQGIDIPYTYSGPSPFAAPPPTPPPATTVRKTTKKPAKRKVNVRRPTRPATKTKGKKKVKA